MRERQESRWMATATVTAVLLLLCTASPVWADGGVLLTEPYPYPTSEPTLWSATPSLVALPAGAIVTDFVDLGTDGLAGEDPLGYGSEADHSISHCGGTGQCSGGDCAAYEWGGSCTWLSGHHIRAMWEQGPAGTTDPSATVTLDFGSLEVNKYIAVIWNRGAGNDSFDIDIQGDPNSPYHIGWLAGSGNNVAISGAFDVGVITGVRTVTFTATAPAWASQTTYGQAMLSEIAVWSGPAPTGACCAADYSCTVETEADCIAAGGTYQGDDVPCDPSPCGAPIILNEYNAVGSEKWLDEDGLEASDASDTHFGRVEGNGGNWIELVVVQDHLDIRNWYINWSEDTDTGTITFANDTLWSDLRAGTIITITESCTAEGGLDTNTGFYALTDWWININTLCGGTAQETYITTTHSSAPNGSFSVGNDDFQMTIYETGGAAAFGPVGEGVCDFSGVGSREVGKLEADPAPEITPCSNYQDGTSSTFGNPNVWGGGDEEQSFTSLRGEVVDVELVPLATPSASDGPTASLPTAVTQVAMGGTFYVEVWARTSDARGLSSVYADIPFNPCLMTAVSITNASAFSLLSGGTIDGTGLIDDLGGNHAVPCVAGYGHNEWVRVGYVEFLSEAHGTASLPASWAGSTYGCTLCGVLGSIDKHQINYGGTTVPIGTASGEVQLVVPSAPQNVPVGQNVTVELRVADLSEAINGVQALIRYNPQNLSLVSTALAAPWDQEYFENDGNGSLAYTAGIAAGSTSADGLVATFTFATLDNGTPVVSFLEDRPEAYPTLCSKLTLGATAQAVLPTKTGMTDGDIYVYDSDECFIGGETYDVDDPNPANECEKCDPATSATSWTPVGAGTACGDAPGDCENQDTCDGAGTCTDNGYKDSSTVCRASAGDCDVAEFCPGDGADCPTDAKSTAECRASAGDCDVAEFCDGVSDDCPADAVQPDTYECRASAGDCDLAEFCDGVGTTCPEDAFLDSTNECRASVGDCDLAEMCPGDAADCPADAKSTAECRASAGDCDLAEFCDGVSDDCPADAFLDSTNECRAAAGDCDLAEMCPGDAADCPADAKSTAECRASAGDCDLAEFCDGVSTDCPIDEIAPADTECRAAAGGCDVAEVCDGVSTNCPTDEVVPADTECRAVAGDCDVAEVCDGVSADCPTDEVVPADTECRAVAGDCDIAEVCDGMSTDCPADSFVALGTECRAAADDCDVAEECTGDSAACPTDEVAPLDTVCRTAAGDCDVAEVCDGVSVACPEDVLVGAGTECRAVAGDCDVAEQCDGLSVDCPIDDFVTSGTECRAAAGDCDIAETCTGSSADCPPDVVADASTECRAVAGDCDVAEQCDGLSVDCPTDDFVASGTECRAATGDCDIAESCDGVSAACPEDAFVASGTACDADGDPCTGPDTCDGGGTCVVGPATAHIYASLQAQALGAAVTRDVIFEIDGIGEVIVPVEFAADGSGYVDLTDLGYLDAEWICAHEGHTLTQAIGLIAEWSGGGDCEATANFYGLDELPAGDLSNRVCVGGTNDGDPCDDAADCDGGVCTEYVGQDALVDIQDFAILFIYWNMSVDPAMGTWGDVTGDGMQDVADFTAIQANFGEVGDACGGSPSTMAGSNATARTRISLRDLKIADASLADLNADNWVDTKDVLLFAEQNNLPIHPNFLLKVDRMERDRRALRESSGPAGHAIETVNGVNAHRR